MAYPASVAKASLQILLASALVFAAYAAAPGYGEETMMKIEPLLPPCPDSPNCVSSLASDEEHKIDAFPLKGQVADSFELLKKVIAAEPRTELKVISPTRLHAEFTSLIMRFTDDVDFAYDEKTNLIQVRSASRVGYGDFGVNRKRIERLRSAYLR